MSKLQTGESTGTFHMENFRRRSRYAAVFAVLAAALFAILSLKYQHRYHQYFGIAYSEDYFSQGRGRHRIQYYLENPNAAYSDGSDSGRSTFSSGFLLQTFFENPIAGPYLLGISSGAKMVVALAMIYFLEKWGKVSSYTLIIAAFAGSLIATGFILLVSRKIKHMATLLIAGTMIGYICSAITDFMVTFAEDSDIVNLHGWSQGSFSGMSWSNVKIAALIIVIAVALTFMLSKPIGAYQLGEAYAQSMGVNIKIFRVTLILLSSVLSATVTAFAGPISFVGIAVPHLVKQALNTSRPLVVVPGTFLGSCILYAQRSDRTYSFCTTGAEYQYRNLNFRRTGSYWNDVKTPERKTVIWQSNI